MKHLLFLVFLLIAFSVTAHNYENQGLVKDSDTQKREQNEPKYTYKIIPSLNYTWCYNIYKSGKMLIHQKSIPGLPGNEGFKRKSDAKKVARLVIKKLKKGEMPPSVTLEEMKNLKVL
jgi:hypothetical protein